MFWRNVWAKCSQKSFRYFFFEFYLFLIKIYFRYFERLRPWANYFDFVLHCSEKIFYKLKINKNYNNQNSTTSKTNLNFVFWFNLVFLFKFFWFNLVFCSNSFLIQCKNLHQIFNRRKYERKIVGIISKFSTLFFVILEQIF